MAKNKGKTTGNTAETEDTDKKTRVLADYVFEEHKEDGTVVSLGLTLHYPSEAKLVQTYLESKREELGIDGIIRVCQKKYS